MSYDTVIWEQDQGVGRITLNRPETLNAWTGEFGAELKQVVLGEASDPSVRAVLVTGGCRGVGRGIATGFLAAGAEVAVEGKGTQALTEDYLRVGLRTPGAPDPRRLAAQTVDYS